MTNKRNQFPKEKELSEEAKKMLEPMPPVPDLPEAAPVVKDKRPVYGPPEPMPDGLTPVEQRQWRLRQQAPKFVIRPK